MLGLAQRIMTQPCAYAVKGENSTDASNSINENKHRVGRSVVIDVTNVYDYLIGFQRDTGNPIDLGPIQVVSPFPQAFFEMTAKTSSGGWVQWGLEVETLDARGDLVDTFERLFKNRGYSFTGRERFFMSYLLWNAASIAPSLGTPTFMGDFGLVTADEDGRHVDSLMMVDPADGEEMYEVHRTALRVMMLACAFLHCKNVTTDERTVLWRPAKKSRNRVENRVPLLTVKTLRIEPMKKVLRTEGNVSENGLKKALHICRGHFATYSEDNPLFGKMTGTFWRPQHVRGDRARGEVKKDYCVHPPETQ